MAWVESSVLAVVRVAMRKRKAAVDAVDAPAQTRQETELNALKPDWLATSYADWQTAGFPAIL